MPPAAHVGGLPLEEMAPAMVAIVAAALAGLRRGTATGRARAVGLGRRLRSRAGSRRAAR